MAFYAFNGEGTVMGRILRTGLDNYRDGVYKLSRINDCFAQMSDQQIVDAIGVSAVSGGNTAVQQAAALKAEMAADVAKLLTDNSQTNVKLSLTQMLAQTG